MALKQQRSDVGSIALPDLVMTVSSRRGHRLPNRETCLCVREGGELRTTVHLADCQGSN